MSGFAVIISVVCFVVVSSGLFYLPFILRPVLSTTNSTLSFSHREVVCNLSDPYSSNTSDIFKPPSLKSFLKASTGVEDTELRLSGLGVLSKLANACQPPVDVSKSRIPVNKIALIRVKKDITSCSLGKLAANAQNAGYSMVVYFPHKNLPTPGPRQPWPWLPDKLLIPFVLVNPDSCQLQYYSTDGSSPNKKVDTLLARADQTNVQVSLTVQSTDKNNLLVSYLYSVYLHFWPFLLGPIITLEWLRRKKKLSCVTTELQVDEEHVLVNMETGLYLIAEESRGHGGREREHAETADELQPLIPVRDDPSTHLITRDNAHRSSGARLVAIIFRKIAGYVVFSIFYFILVLAALPVGITFGGLSFFLFDVSLPWGPFFIPPLIAFAVALWWPVLQIFCFLMYSLFACKSTWTIQTNFSKLIRSDWFSSNIYLFVLCVVVPYCSFTVHDLHSLFFYNAVYNTVYTVCNFLFIIFLNKHKFVTRYVFYISVCMICAYVESDIVAVFYFIMNSQGSLANLKLTALRTLAIGLYLSLSFNSSMHIVRKIMKPRESLLEGLSEK